MTATSGGPARIFTTGSNQHPNPDPTTVAGCSRNCPLQGTTKVKPTAQQLMPSRLYRVAHCDHAAAEGNTNKKTQKDKAALGVEPRLQESETYVIPLHYAAELSAC